MRNIFRGKSWGSGQWAVGSRKKGIETPRLSTVDSPRLTITDFTGSLSTGDCRPPTTPDPWQPIDPRDGKPRLVLTWVTTDAGSGFVVDTFNIVSEQIASFYMDGGAAVASLTRQSEGESNGTATESVEQIPADSAPAHLGGNQPNRTGPTQPPRRPRAVVAAGATPAEE